MQSKRAMQDTCDCTGTARAKWLECTTIVNGLSTVHHISTHFPGQILPAMSLCQGRFALDLPEPLQTNVGSLKLREGDERFQSHSKVRIIAKRSTESGAGRAEQRRQFVNVTFRIN